MNNSPSVRSNIRVTVTATAVIINLVVIILLDEVYGCIARWLTKIGEGYMPGVGGQPSCCPLAVGPGFIPDRGLWCLWPASSGQHRPSLSQRSQRQRRASRTD
jgi:hypothetical protein